MLPGAFAERQSTENKVDHEAPIKVCRICGQPQLDTAPAAVLAAAFPLCACAAATVC
jgi:hypothetical protein